MSPGRSTARNRAARLDLRIGPERVIADVRDGIITQLSHIQVWTLGGLDYPLSESSTNERRHGGIDLLALQLSPSVIKRLGDNLRLIGVETGL